MSNITWPSNAIFIFAPREMSQRRFTQIVKHYLPKGPIVLGISNEAYVVGFENQPQFRMLRQETVQGVIDKVTASYSENKIQVIAYSQAEIDSVIKDLTVDNRVLLVNGSWKYAFHNSAAYKILEASNVAIKFISPFADKDEAKDYEIAHSPQLVLPEVGTFLNEHEMFGVADTVALKSYDYSFQTGVAVGKKKDDKYELIGYAFNKVIPYQTYAMHHGNQREKHRSQPNDTNHYDTIHAEMMFLTDTIRDKTDIAGSTLFINLLPCPNCARTLSQTTIDGIVYRNDHSGGYAEELLKLCGKKVKRL